MVRLTGSNAQPGRSDVSVAGLSANEDGPNHWWGRFGELVVGAIDVAQDGTFSAELTLPGTITDAEPGTRDGVPEPKDPAACLATPSACEITVGLPDGWFDAHQGSNERALRPGPIPYPAEP